MEFIIKIELQDKLNFPTYLKSLTLKDPVKIYDSLGNYVATTELNLTNILIEEQVKEVKGLPSKQLEVKLRKEETIEEPKEEFKSVYLEKNTTTRNFIYWLQDTKRNTEVINDLANNIFNYYSSSKAIPNFFTKDMLATALKNMTYTIFTELNEYLEFSRMPNYINKTVFLSVNMSQIATVYASTMKNRSAAASIVEQATNYTGTRILNFLVILSEFDLVDFNKYASYSDLINIISKCDTIRELNIKMLDIVKKSHPGLKTGKQFVEENTPKEQEVRKNISDVSILGENVPHNSKNDITRKFKLDSSKENIDLLQKLIMSNKNLDTYVKGCKPYIKTMLSETILSYNHLGRMITNYIIPKECINLITKVQFKKINKCVYFALTVKTIGNWTTNIFLNVSDLKFKEIE